MTTPGTETKIRIALLVVKVRAERGVISDIDACRIVASNLGITTETVAWCVSEAATL